MNNAQKTYKIYESLLQKNGITSYKIFKETGVPQSSLSEWKRGNSVPKYDKLQKIADYFGVSVDYLLGNAPAGPRHIKNPVFDDEALELMEEMHKRPEMKVLFKVSKRAKKEDIEAVSEIIKRMIGEDD